MRRKAQVPPAIEAVEEGGVGAAVPARGFGVKGGGGPTGLLDEVGEVREAGADDEEEYFGACVVVEAPQHAGP